MGISKNIVGSALNKSEGEASAESAWRMRLQEMLIE
jgi:hypothetical protein